MRGLPAVSALVPATPACWGQKEMATPTGGQSCQVAPFPGSSDVRGPLGCPPSLLSSCQGLYCPTACLPLLTRTGSATPAFSVASCLG